MARPNITSLVNPRKEAVRKEMLRKAGSIQDNPEISQAAVPDPERIQGQLAMALDRYGPTMSKDVIHRIIKAHRADFSDFIAEHGDKVKYATHKLYDWLGY